MEWNPLTIFVLSLATICSLCCWVLMTRARWMWYAAWPVFGLCAYVIAEVFMSMERADVKWVASTIVLWLTAAVWWARSKDKFGKPVRKPAAKRAGTVTQGDGGGSGPGM